MGNNIMRNSVTEIRKKIYNLKSSIADLPLPAGRLNPEWSVPEKVSGEAS